MSLLTTRTSSPPAPAPPPGPIDAPPTAEELAWWGEERHRVYRKRFLWSLLVTGGFNAVAMFSRSWLQRSTAYLDPKGFFVITMAALIASALVSAATLHGETGKQRDRHIRQRRLRAALEAEAPATEQERA